jgi:AcrR family transcriptional regulator
VTQNAKKGKIAPPESARNSRRSSAEIRGLILRAAYEAFTESGYAGATTARIAAGAGVSEKLIFRHFGGKAQLFVAAVMDPLYEFLRGLHARFDDASRDGHTTEEFITTFVADLYDLLSTHRAILFAFITATYYEADVMALAEAGQHTGTPLHRLERLIDREVRARGIDSSTLDISALVRCLIGMILGIAVTEPLTNPSAPDHLSRDRLVNGFARLALHGFLGTDTATATA